MKFFQRSHILVLIGLLLGLGVAAVLVYQGFLEDLPTPVSADLLLNGPIETNDIVQDGNGISHSSTVRYYRRAISPFDATVYWVKYGGRYYSSGCVTNNYWKHNGIKYYRWDGSNWVEDHSVASEAWERTGNPGLHYRTNYETVDLDGGALVVDKIRYKWYDFCAPEGLDLNIPGRHHFHYLE